MSIVEQKMNLNETDSGIKVDCGKDGQCRWNNSQGDGSTQAGRGSAFFANFDGSNVEVNISASDWSFSFKGSNSAHLCTLNALPSISCHLSAKRPEQSNETYET